MTSAGLAEILHGNPVFKGVPLRELQGLAAVAREQSYRAREVIFEEGQPALWFCLVRSGHVKIVRAGRGGRDVVLELLGPGEPFGGVAVIERRPYPASAQATEPSVILKIPQEAIVPIAERNPSLVREMAFMIGRRLRAAHDQAEPPRGVALREHVPAGRHAFLARGRGERPEITVGEAGEHRTGADDVGSVAGWHQGEASVEPAASGDTSCRSAGGVSGMRSTCTS